LVFDGDVPGLETARASGRSSRTYLRGKWKEKTPGDLSGVFVDLESGKNISPHSKSFPAPAEMGWRVIMMGPKSCSLKIPGGGVSWEERAWKDRGKTAGWL